MIFYTNRFIAVGAAGCARGPVIFIRPQFQSDKGLLEHERIHVKQWWKTFGMHSFLYVLSKSYRFKSEVEAYREQAKWYPDDRLPRFAGFIAKNYRLDVPESEALAALLE